MLVVTDRKTALLTKEPFVYIRPMTFPMDVQAMKRATVVVTTEGGPVCHAAIICKALRIPALIGVTSIKWAGPIPIASDTKKPLAVVSVSPTEVKAL